MSTIDFHELVQLIPASLHPESAEELTGALATGRWWAIMEVLHPIDEGSQFDYTSLNLSQTLKDDIESASSGPAETADESPVPETSVELADALAAGCWWEIVEVEHPIDREPKVDISSMRFWGNLEALGTSGPSSPGVPVPASVPKKGKSQKELSGAPVSAGSRTPAQVVESALGPAVCADDGNTCQKVSAKPETPQKSSHKAKVRVLKGVQPAAPLRRMTASKDICHLQNPPLRQPKTSPVQSSSCGTQNKACVDQLPLQNEQHVKVVASDRLNLIAEPQPEEQQQDKPESSQKTSSSLDRRAIRDLQPADHLRRMRVWNDICHVQNPPLRQPKTSPVQSSCCGTNKACVNHLPLTNEQHVKVVASDRLNLIAEPQPEEQQVMRDLQPADHLRRMRVWHDFHHLQNPPLRQPRTSPLQSYSCRTGVNNNGDFARH